VLWHSVGIGVLWNILVERVRADKYGEGCGPRSLLTQLLGGSSGVAPNCLAQLILARDLFAELLGAGDALFLWWLRLKRDAGDAAQFQKRSAPATR
jgi:hypothetical protein